jgi:hypothetical protein
VTELRKGARVRAEWLEASPPGGWSLAGVQRKLPATRRVVEGVVTRIRGDHPTEPSSVGVWIMQDDGAEVVVDARHVVLAG